MSTRYAETERERTALLLFIEQQKLPLAVSVNSGSPRTTKQNRLQRQWCNEIADQLGDRTAEEVRGEAKLTFGVPILRAASEDYRRVYDKHVKGLPYHQKLALMMEPFDFAVTRLMTTRQHTNYLDAMHRHYSERGIALTDPGDLLAQADARAAEAA